MCQMALINRYSENMTEDQKPPCYDCNKELSWWPSDGNKINLCERCEARRKKQNPDYDQEC